jgi:hypothetical protein
MKIFQLVARGPILNFGDEHSYHSRKVFYTPEAAEAKKADFLAICTRERPDCAGSCGDHRKGHRTRTGGLT